MMHRARMTIARSGARGGASNGGKYGRGGRGRNGGGRGRNGGGRGRNGGGHFHAFPSQQMIPGGQQQHLQDFGNTSNHVQVTAPRKYKHAHSSWNDPGAPNVHSHNFSSPVVQHWTGRPGVGPQGGYSVQQSPIPEWPSIHGYRHIHPGTIGGTPGGGRSRRGGMQRGGRGKYAYKPGQEPGKLPSCGGPCGTTADCRAGCECNNIWQCVPSSPHPGTGGGRIGRGSISNLDGS